MKPTTRNTLTPAEASRDRRVLKALGRESVAAQTIYNWIKKAERLGLRNFWWSRSWSIRGQKLLAVGQITAWARQVRGFRRGQ